MKSCFQAIPFAITCRTAASVFRVNLALLASTVFSLGAFGAASGPMPDSYGKNCSTATAIGTLSNGQTVMRQGTLHAAVVEDWFSVSFVPGTTLTISVQNASAGDNGTNFQVDVMPSCGAAAIGSTQGTQDAKQFTLNGQAPHTVIVRVRADHWNAAHPMFKLAFAVQTAPARPGPKKVMQ